MTTLPSVVVLTTEPPPLPGMPTTGAGLRAWALAQGLRAAGHEDVTLVVAADAFAAQGGKVPAIPAAFASPGAIANSPVSAFFAGGAPKIQAVRRADLPEWFATHRPEAVVAQHWGLLRQAGPLDCPLAIDLAGPHLLERLHWGSPDPAADRREKLEQLARADFAVCSGPRQRAYFIPYLLEAGFAPDAQLCPVILYSMPPDLPGAGEKRDPALFVFGGFFLPWQDPERPLRLLLEECDARGKGALEFFGGMHPTLDVSRGRFESLLDFIESHPRVHRRGVVPFEEMARTLPRCGVALDLLPRNLERELAFPSRTAVYLWSGVPVIHGNYDDFSPLIEEYGAGWTLAPADEDGTRRLFGRLLADAEHGGEEIRKASEGARRLVSERLAWDRTIAPLADWTRDPKPRKGKIQILTAPLSSCAPSNSSSTGLSAAPQSAGEELRLAREQAARLREELETLQRAHVVQISRRARGFSPFLAPFAYIAAALVATGLFLFFLAADAFERLTGRPPRPHSPKPSRQH